MQIGPYRFNQPLILAPMAGVTDLPFRQLCRRFGADLAISEMVTADTSLWGSRKSLSRLNHQHETAPIAVQIVGADPDKLAAAARINVGLGAQIIDINMGCPAKKVCKVAAGSALLRDEKLVARILDAVVAAVDVPVTLKIRTGWDQHERNALEIGRLAEAAGVAALSVHGRTRAEGFSGQAEYSTIRQLKRALRIPVIANGDIDSPQKARQVLDDTGADGLMLGRVAQGCPWIFTEMRHYLQTGQLAPQRTPDEILVILLAHLEELYRFYGSEHGVRIARKHIGWYSKAQRHAAEFRQAVFAATTPSEQQRIITSFFHQASFQESTLHKELAA